MLEGKAFQVVGQTGAALHIMAVLQVYLADLLKELGTSRGNVSEVFFFFFLSCAMPQICSLHVTKQTARAVL